MGRKLARLAGRLGCLAMSSYVARPHVLADQFVPGYLGDSFGLFPFVHGDPLANQFDGPFLIRLIGEEVTHTSGFPLGIESRDPDIPSCWHSGTMRPSCCWSIPCHNQADPVPTANLKRLTASANRLILAADERSLQVDLVRLDRNIPTAGCVASREPGPSTSTQRAAAQGTKRRRGIRTS